MGTLLQHSGHYYGKKTVIKVRFMQSLKVFWLIRTVYTENVSGLIWARVHIFHFKTSVKNVHVMKEKKKRV